MIKKLAAVCSILLSLCSYAIVVTDKYLSTIEENWLSLEPADAYNFIPEDLTYETYMSEDFQAKLAEAGTRLNSSVEGKDITLAGFMVPIEYVGTNISKFLLVPEAGQCIHVPPPPLNQTLLVARQRCQVAVIGSDTGNDVAPNPYDLFTNPVHQVGIVGLGLWILDNAWLDDLANACRERGKWEFMISILPLKMPTVTGSPVNPMVIF